MPTQILVVTSPPICCLHAARGLSSFHRYTRHFHRRHLAPIYLGTRCFFSYFHSQFPTSFKHSILAIVVAFLPGALGPVYLGTMCISCYLRSQSPTFFKHAIHEIYAAFPLGGTGFCLLLPKFAFPVYDFFLTCHPINLHGISAGEHLDPVYFRNWVHFLLFLFSMSDFCCCISMSKEYSSQYPTQFYYNVHFRTMDLQKIVSSYIRSCSGYNFNFVAALIFYLELYNSAVIC